ncbi:cyclic 3',5'-adenosine monophosphate phosphodiesterase [bacterium YEK0313]|nr:cyclic 3',5'-adenosine monophosphate phosphodiesterase [bacterium YEK0313]
MTVIAHLSDLHIGPVPFPRALPLRLKPVLGWINWARQRGAHEAALLQRALAAVRDAGADHIVVTGDLIELGQDTEWRAAAAAAAALGPAGQVAWAPGNHDLYTRDAPVRIRAGLAPWLAPAEPCDDIRAHFPRLDRVGDVALVTLCTGAPTWLFSAEGALGAGQLARLDRLLAGLDRQRCLPVIAMHHPPYAPGLSRLKQLRDGAALLDLADRHGCQVILHGHLHRACRVDWQGAHGRIALIGAASASAAGHGHDDPASFNLVTVTRTPDGFAWQVERRPVG